MTVIVKNQPPNVYWEFLKCQKKKKIIIGDLTEIVAIFI